MENSIKGKEDDPLKEGENGEIKEDNSEGKGTVHVERDIELDKIITYLSKRFGNIKKKDMELIVWSQIQKSGVDPRELDRIFYRLKFRSTLGFKLIKMGKREEHCIKCGKEIELGENAYVGIDDKGAEVYLCLTCDVEGGYSKEEMERDIRIRRKDKILETLKREIDQKQSALERLDMMSHPKQVEALLWELNENLEKMNNNFLNVPMEAGRQAGNNTLNMILEILQRDSPISRGLMKKILMMIREWESFYEEAIRNSPKLKAETKVLEKTIMSNPITEFIKKPQDEETTYVFNSIKNDDPKGGRPRVDRALGHHLVRSGKYGPVYIMRTLHCKEDTLQKLIAEVWEEDRNKKEKRKDAF